MQTDFDQIIDRLNKGQLWTFPGGVFPAQHKELSNHLPIISLPLPRMLFVTVKQHIGVEGHVIVEPGDKVLKGQALSKSMNPFAVPVHAPTSGTVINIAPHPSAHPSGFPDLTVQIEADYEDKWIELKPLKDYQNQPKMSVLAAICEAGISGMGGAGFPTHIKAAPKKNVEFLIINGVECEPYISSDDRLMREHAWQIRQGIDVLTHLLSPKHVIIAIEDNKAEAIQAMQIACHENAQYRVCSIPTKYPAGGEKQLIQVLTNREVPKQGLPNDVGVIMHNVGTCYAIADAIFTGKPLIQRVVTMSGEALNKPGNVWALIGTPIEHLLAQAEYQPAKQTDTKVIMGGPMMGFTVVSNQVPVVKTSNCILLPADHEITGNDREQACIRCGACADVCPASLLPQQLFWHSKAKELEKAQDYNLFDCIECGACAYVCPSEIPLVHYYRIAKADIRNEQQVKQQADKARERFEARSARLISEQHERDEKHRKAAEARKLAMESNGGDAKDKIAAALARAKARKQHSATTDSNAPQAPAEQVMEQTWAPGQSAQTPTGTSKNDKVAAAIERAKAKRAAAMIASALDENDVSVQPNETLESLNESPVSLPPVPDQKEKIAVKIARKKAQKATLNKAAENSVDEATSVQKSAEIAIEHTAKTIAPLEATQSGQKTHESTDQISKPAKRRKATASETSVKALSEPLKQDNKKAKVLTAVARAKAKRAAQQQDIVSEDSQNTAPDNPSNHSVSDANEEEQKLAAKKHRIAVAVAKAKAKKAVQQQHSEEN